MLFPLFLVLSLLSFTQAGASWRAKDTEFWLENSVKRKGEGKVEVSLLTEDRWRENASTLSYQAFQGNFKYLLSESWACTISYRQALEKEEGKWKPEGSSRISLIRNWEYKEIKGNIRHMMEYKIKSCNLTYRNRIYVNFPSLFSSTLHPFLMNELFLNENLSENRIRIGLSTPSSSSFQTAIAYQMLLKRFSSTWYGIHVPFLAFSLTF
jgi:hypothetical protein